MGGPARSRVGARVDGRAHERVVELHAAGAPGARGRPPRRRASASAGAPARASDREVAVVAGGRDEQRRTRPARAASPRGRRTPRRVARAAAPGRRPRRRRPAPRARAARAGCRRSLRGGGRRAGVVPRRAQQGARGRAVEPAEREDRQIAAVEQRRLAGAHGEHDGDGIGEQPPQREAQRVGARVVEPVRVVDEHERRRDLRLRGEQAQRRRADGEAVAAAARPQRQRPAERRRLGPRDLRELAERRAQQLEQAGERHRRLGLHAARPQHPHRRRRARRRASSSAVLPMPTSPTRASTPLVPARASATRRSSRRCSESRPSSTPRSYD